MIVLVGIEKGGTGKSTLASNLAVMRAKAGKEVLLVDSDKQLTASYFSAQRDQNGLEPRIVCIQKRGAGIFRDLIDLASKYEDVIIDAGGQDSTELRSSLGVANVLCMPFQPAQPDIWTLETMNGLVEKAKALNPDLRIEVVINRASTNRKNPEIREATECIADYEYLPYSGLVVHDRRSFRKAMMMGMSVVELTSDDKDAKAISEITALYNKIYNS